MLEKIKKLLGMSKPDNVKELKSQIKTPTLNSPNKVSPKPLAIDSARMKAPKGIAHLDNNNAKMIRLSGKGNEILKKTLTMQINACPGFRDMFEIGCNNRDVIIFFKKGFGDDESMRNVHSLYRRRLFIENCMLWGVENIVFIDKIANTFDILEVDSADYQNWP